MRHLSSSQEPADQRAATGVPGLDTLIRGGFPKGDLILVTGSPGTGKTILSASFLYEGAKQGENVVYVSFGEGRTTFLRNMSSLGDAFSRMQRLVQQRKFRILDLVTVREEGITPTLNRIFEEISSCKASRLVIDPFTTLSQAFRETIDSRIVLHTVLGKMVREIGCTTILVDEVPLEEEKVGTRMEEFVADAVIILRKTRIDGKLAREMEIAKLRGTELPQDRCAFTLHGGFRVFTPFPAHEAMRPARVPRRRRRFKTIKHTATHYSSGWKDLDSLLGGFEKGTQVAFEVEEAVPMQALRLILKSIITSFVLTGRSVLIGATQPFEREELQGWVRSFLGKRKSKSAVRVVSFDKNQTEDIPNASTDTWTSVKEKLGKRVKPPSLIVLLNNTSKPTAISARDLHLIRKEVRANQGLLIVTADSTPTARRALLPSSHTYVRILQSHGAILLYGLKPRTSLTCLELLPPNLDTPALTPIA